MSNITRSRTFEITKECEYPSDYVVIDFETNGLEPRTCGIIQMAAVRYRNDVKVDTFTSFVYTTIIPPKVSELTSITLDDCKTAPRLEELLPQLLEFIGNDVIVAHNAAFDLGFLTESMERLNLPGRTFIYVDTLRLARQKIKDVKWYKLPILKRYLKLEYNSHLAEDDCYVCHEVYKYCRGLSLNQTALSRYSIPNSEQEELYYSAQLTQIELEEIVEQAKYFETKGNPDEAINLYEKCIAVQCKNKEPYDRLILLYRKKRQKENEIRVLELAIKVLKPNDKYRLRLDKILNR